LSAIGTFIVWPVRYRPVVGARFATRSPAIGLCRALTCPALKAFDRSALAARRLIPPRITLVHVPAFFVLGVRHFLSGLHNWWRESFGWRSRVPSFTAIGPIVMPLGLPFCCGPVEPKPRARAAVWIFGPGVSATPAPMGLLCLGYGAHCFELLWQSGPWAGGRSGPFIVHEETESVSIFLPPRRRPA